MYDEAFYRDILKKYPQTISKEQLYKLCHISKRVAKYYLDHGIIPCTNTGHATHKYTIKTVDVIAFIRQRDKTPDKFRVSVPNGSRYKPVVRPSITYTPAVLRSYQRLLAERAITYPDLMTVQMIAEFTGYSVKTIHTWTTAGYLRWFRNGPKYYAPKELLLKYMQNEAFRGISNKSRTHYDMIRQLIDMMNKEEKEHE